MQFMFVGNTLWNKDTEEEKMTNEIKLGFQVISGEPVSIPFGHIITTGLTNMSGKSTTLEKIAFESKCKVLAFTTKSGEKVFKTGNTIRPFYQQKVDWRYVETILESAMKEKLKLERAFIIKASNQASTLNDVYNNCIKLRDKAKENSFQHSIFTNIIAYFELVLPELEKIDLAESLYLEDGINIMDLEDIPDEVQSLIIASCIEYVQLHESNTIICIPESWKFIPEKRNNPVKYSAEKFIRQGATKRNFMALDSQDISGVSKAILKQVSIWILGLQLESNEVQHTIDQVPLERKSKPSPNEIMHLEKGHFIVCTPKMTKNIYVAPIWLPEPIAIKIAKKELSVDAANDYYPKESTTHNIKHEKHLPSKPQKTITPMIESIQSKEQYDKGFNDGRSSMNSELKDKMKEFSSQVEMIMHNVIILKNYTEELISNEESAITTTPSITLTDSSIVLGMRVMMSVLLKFHNRESLTRHQLKLLSVIASDSTFSTYITKLKELNYVDESNSIVSLTQNGLEFISSNKLDTSIEKQYLISSWAGKLVLGARRMLEIIASQPENKPISKEDLKNEAKIESYSTLSTYKQKLVYYGLIDESNGYISLANAFYLSEKLHIR